MKKLLALILALLMLCACGVREEQPDEELRSDEKVADTKDEKIYVDGWTANFEPSDFDSYDEYYNAFLNEWLKNLEPKKIFATESEYPFVIKDIFEIYMEKNEYHANAVVTDISVLGDENEFYVHYEYIAEFRENNGLDDDGHLMIRVRKMEDGKYELLASGGGYPVSYGLEKSDVSIADVWQGEEKTRDEALTEWAENLEPIEILDTKYAYPEVIGEIFEIMMESEPEERKAEKLNMIEVYGGANEFYVRYKYTPKGFKFGTLCVRIRINNDGLYTLVARGEGPIWYGLEKNDITAKDIGI